MKNKKVHEQVLGYSYEERNSVIAGGNKLFLFLLCSIIIVISLGIGLINSTAVEPMFYYAIASLVLIFAPLVWVKIKYPLYKEERYHYIKAIKKKMGLINRSFEDDDMYKTTVSEFSQPMEWYGSLVLGLMFVWIFVSVINGVSYITGTIYGATSDMKITAEQMYQQFGMGLKILDIFVGVLSIVSAVLTVFAWKALNTFKKSAPKLVVSVYAIGLISTIIYVLGWYVIGIDSDLTNIPYLVVNAALLIGNSIYFKKRANWFVH